MNSWKCSGALASPKGIFGYSYFLKGDVKAVLGIESSLRDMWWYPAQRSRVDKYLTLLNLEKNVFYFGHGPDNLLGDLVQDSVVDDKAFSTANFRYNDDQSWQAGMTTTHDFCV